MNDDDIITPSIESAPCFEGDGNPDQFLTGLQCQVRNESEASAVDKVGVIAGRRVVVQYCFENYITLGSPR